MIDATLPLEMMLTVDRRARLRELALGRLRRQSLCLRSIAPLPP